MDDYLGFAFKMLIMFGIIFELPVLLSILALLNLVTTKKLMSFQRYMVVITFVVAAILTPPDVVSQTIMAIPMILLFEVGVFFVWIIESKNRK